MEDEFERCDLQDVIEQFGLLDLFHQLANPKGNASDNALLTGLSTPEKLDEKENAELKQKYVDALGQWDKPLKMVISNAFGKYIILSSNDKKLLFGNISDLRETLKTVFDKTMDNIQDENKENSKTECFGDDRGILLSKEDSFCHVMNLQLNSYFDSNCSLLTMKLSPCQCYIGIVSRKQILCYQIASLFNQVR